MQCVGPASLKRVDEAASGWTAPGRCCAFFCYGRVLVEWVAERRSRNGVGSVKPSSGGGWCAKDNGRIAILLSGFVSVAIAGCVTHQGTQVGLMASETKPVLIGRYATPHDGGCNWIARLYYRVDCSPDGAQGLGTGPAPWIGPHGEGTYYPVNGAGAVLAHIPSPSDDRAPPVVLADIAVSSPGRGAAPEVVRGTLVVGPSA